MSKKKPTPDAVIGFDGEQFTTEKRRVPRVPAWVEHAAARGVYLVGGDAHGVKSDEAVVAHTPFADLAHATPFTDMSVACGLIHHWGDTHVDVVRLNADTARMLLVGKESRGIVAIFDILNDYTPEQPPKGLDAAQLANELRQRLSASCGLSPEFQIDERVPMVQIWLGSAEAAERQGVPVCNT